MRAAALGVALVLAAAAAAGCGGGDDNGARQPTANGETGSKGGGSDRAQIERTVREFIDALNAADGERACPLLTNNGEGVLAGVLASDQADLDCKEVVER